MNRLIGAILTVSLLLVGSVALAPESYACSIAETFVVTIDHLGAGDFNDPDSQLARDYREWHGDDTATIEIRGVYVYETIHAVASEGDWSRGSVSVATELWGEWPGDISPRVATPQDQSGEPPDNCGWFDSGRDLGTRDYRLISDARDVEFGWPGNTPDADAMLTAAFGAPAIPERDSALERDLIAEIEASRASRVGFYVGVGLAAIALAVGVLYFARRGR